jgi:hypothetical protein
MPKIEIQKSFPVTTGRHWHFRGRCWRHVKSRICQKEYENFALLEIAKLQEFPGITRFSIKAELCN